MSQSVIEIFYEFRAQGYSFVEIGEATGKSAKSIGKYLVGVPVGTPSAELLQQRVSRHALSNIKAGYFQPTARQMEIAIAALGVAK